MLRRARQAQGLVGVVLVSVGTGLRFGIGVALIVAGVALVGAALADTLGGGA